MQISPGKRITSFRKISKNLNDELADKYNPQGSFPFTILLDSNGNKIKVWDGFYKDGAESFVNEIKVITETN